MFKSFMTFKQLCGVGILRQTIAEVLKYLDILHELYVTTSAFFLTADRADKRNNQPDLLLLEHLHAPVTFTLHCMFTSCPSFWMSQATELN